MPVDNDWIDVMIVKWKEVYKWMDGWMDMPGWVSGWVCIDHRCMDGWVSTDG